jgi:hypothetical protein
MCMSCGRSDAEPTNYEGENLPAHTPPCRPAIESNYYNRLEYRHSFRLLYAVMRSVLCLFAAVPQPPEPFAFGTPIRLMEAQAFLSLLQGRQSCQQQFWGVIPFRRDIA